MTSPAWTDDRVDLLTRLWAEGLSASEVARRLGGVSRNAVIGKLHRLGRLRGRPSRPRRLDAPPRTSKARTLEAASAPRSRRLPNLRPEPPPAGPLVPLTALRAGRCRWPYGDPKADGFGFCGAHAPRGPYCPAHSAVAFAPGGGDLGRMMAVGA